ncbi:MULTISPECIES: DUF805 domain-containing protein [Mannheimia]|uniref:DUF805 domain-containing protein n=1 Tax=Mannheimia pernigra TaxID=111844 RepID=A0A7D5HSC1_9PAST|nr:MULTISPECIES: DUF805 domain-containing protein [Mannheimia]QLB40152.1 DUF805 domain-containing protein [Mannheimia pernigra]QLB42140.1 DUF805 domain-containing protein [Mannheimia pernigra]QTM00621.1 DUF805 domain-containing protein [Mannheimia sp. ZY171111]
MLWYNVLFGFKGRLNRRGFWIGLLINFVFLLIAVIFMVDLANFTFLSFLPLWISVFSLSAIIVKRLHDRDRSGQALLMVLVPIICYLASLYTQGIMQILLGNVMPAVITMILLLEWGVFKGNRNPNKYGERGLSFKLRE